MLPINSKLSNIFMLFNTVVALSLPTDFIICNFSGADVVVNVSPATVNTLSLSKLPLKNLSYEIEFIKVNFLGSQIGSQIIKSGILAPYISVSDSAISLFSYFIR
jgi:hypothetical protein